MDPVAARRGGAPIGVAVPSLGPGEKRDGSADDFGAMSLYLVLASRLGPKVALAAAEGWGGDRYVAFTKGARNQKCLRISFRGDTKADAADIADALDQWVVDLPAGAASVRRAGGIATLTACDTSGTTAPTQESLDNAVSMLVDRNDLVLEFLDQHAPIVVARCVADRVVVDPAVGPLLTNDRLTDAETQLVRDRISQDITDCRST